MELFWNKQESWFLNLYLKKKRIDFNGYKLTKAGIGKFTAFGPNLIYSLFVYRVRVKTGFIF